MTSTTKSSRSDGMLNTQITRANAESVLKTLAGLYGSRPLGSGAPPYALFDGVGVIFPTSAQPNAPLMKVWIAPSATQETLDALGEVINRDTQFADLVGQKKISGFGQADTESKEGVKHTTRFSTSDLGAIENIFAALIRAFGDRADIDTLHQALAAAHEELGRTRRVTGPAASVSFALARNDDRMSLGWRWEGSTFKCCLETDLDQMRRPVVNALRNDLGWHVIRGWLS